MSEDKLARELADGPVLTDRQAEAIALQKRGANKVEIAEELGISVNTVENHLQRADNRIQKAEDVLDLLETLQDPRETDVDDRIIGD